MQSSSFIVIHHIYSFNTLATNDITCDNAEVTCMGGSYFAVSTLSGEGMERGNNGIEWSLLMHMVGHLHQDVH